MIAFVHGKLVQKTPTSIVVQTQGVGLEIAIPLSSFEALGDVGNDVHILTHLHVREDAMQLFGFVTEDELSLFQKLISVSGIGPRTAQGILSGISVDELKRAIVSHNIDVIKSAPGIGKKTAERLVLELKDKIEGMDEETTSQMPPSKVGEEAVLALMTLGYKQNKAQALVSQTLKTDPSLSVEEIVKRSLRQL